MASALLLAATVTVDQWTAGWTRRRVAGGALLAIVGIAAAGVPQSVHLGGWALAAVTIAAALVVAYVSVLRFDLTMVPLALGTMTAVSALVRAAERPYPGALIGIDRRRRARLGPRLVVVQGAAARAGADRRGLKTPPARV